MNLRIASLVPSVTETLVALGLGPWLVARTGFCIHPEAQLRDVAKVGGTKDVNLPRLRALAPTHVVVNVDENRRDTVEQLRTFVPEVIVTHPCTPHDNLRLVSQLQHAFEPVADLRGRAEALREQIDAELEATRRWVAQQALPAQQVLYLIWREPWMTVARDTYISRMLELIRWQTLPAVDGGTAGQARYPVVQGQEPWLAGLDRVLLSSEPYRFDDRHLAVAQRLAPAAAVQCVDGERLSWYGVRAIQGLRLLRELASQPAGGP